MSVVFIALPIALLMGAAAAWACTRCISAGQFDDLETPPLRVLLEEKLVNDPKLPRSESSKPSN